MSNQEIYIIGTSDYDTIAKGGIDTAIEYQSVRIEDLKRNLSNFLGSMSSIFSDVEKNIGNLELKDITIDVGVSASGKIGLIGFVESGIEGGISITLKRKETHD